MTKLSQIGRMLKELRPSLRAAEIERLTEDLLHPLGESVHTLFSDLCEVVVVAFDHVDPSELDDATLAANPATAPLMRYLLEALYRYRDVHEPGMKTHRRRQLLSESFGLSGSNQYTRPTRSSEAKSAYAHAGIDALLAALEAGVHRPIAIRRAFEAMHMEYRTRSQSSGVSDPRTAKRLRAEVMKPLLREAIKRLAMDLGEAS